MGEVRAVQSAKVERAARVEELRVQIAAGTYAVSAADVAERILAAMLRGSAVSGRRLY